MKKTNFFAQNIFILFGIIILLYSNLIKAQDQELLAKNKAQWSRLSEAQKQELRDRYKEWNSLPEEKKKN